MKSSPRINRRQFIIQTAAIGGGLALACAFSVRCHAGAKQPPRPPRSMRGS